MESLEHTLDSFAKGESGHGTSQDEVFDRRGEARAYILKQNGYRAVFNSTVPDPNPIDYVVQFKTDMDAFIETKYGWKMQTLMLDMHGNPSEFSRYVFPSIRLFCEEHKITMVREI